MMSRFKKIVRVLGNRSFWISTFVLSSAGGAQALGADVRRPDALVWMDARREIEKGTLSREFSAPVAKIIARLEEGADYETILTISYASALPSDLDALDSFWTRFLTSRQDEAGFRIFMQVRSQTLGLQQMDRQSMLENWLYLAQDGSYDCSGGGGGNCGVGVGGGGGDGTTSEGGGQPDGDGDSGGGNDTRPGNV